MAQNADMLRKLRSATRLSRTSYAGGAALSAHTTRAQNTTETFPRYKKNLREKHARSQVRITLAPPPLERSSANTTASVISQEQCFWLQIAQKLSGPSPSAARISCAPRPWVKKSQSEMDGPAGGHFVQRRAVEARRRRRRRAKPPATIFVTRVPEVSRALRASIKQIPRGALNAAVAPIRRRT